MTVDVFMLCLVPVFAAVDPVGLVPVFVVLTDGIDRRRIRKIVIESTITAAVVAMGFILFGEWLLGYLGINVADIQIAGGALLFVIAMRNLFGEDGALGKHDKGQIGAVPIGVPLIAGPGLLTTCIVLAQENGRPMTALAVAIVLAIAGTLLYFSRRVLHLLGRAGAQTASKLAAMLLAAIAVMLLRKGIEGVIVGIQQAVG